MSCYRVDMPGGGSAIVCTRERHHACSARDPVVSTYCGRTGRFQCDWVGPHGGTCNRYLCGMHAHEIGEDRHLCPKHRKAWEEQQRQGTLAL